MVAAKFYPSIIDGRNMNFIVSTSRTQSFPNKPIPLIQHFSDLAQRYDAFIIDLWGVLHDGVTAYPGAADCMRQLKKLGKKTLLLSNAPRRARVVAEGTAKIGFTPDLYNYIYSSGEETWQQLKDRRDPWHRRLGEKCLAIVGDSDLNFFEGLNLKIVQQPDQAEFFLAIGARHFGEEVKDYEAVLKQAIKYSLPMLCVNPDLEIIRNGKREICAGALAKCYEEWGGEVRYHGKPHPAVYQEALKLLGNVPKNKILAIGDALRTDIMGAQTMGVDSLWILGGIHAESLQLDQPQGLEQRVAQQCQQAGLSPIAALPKFIW